MAKYYGLIGYSKTEETSPGVWRERIIERSYYGDVTRNTIQWSTSSESTNDNLNISNQFSIVADNFAIENFYYMRYIEFMGAKWKITNVDIQPPRLILTVGGLYNGQQA